MATENIDIVVRSDTRRVVRDLNAIGSAADQAHRRVQNLQAQLNRLSTNNFSRQVHQAQNAVNGFGSGHHLAQFQAAIAQVTQQLQQLNQQLNQTANASQRMSNTVGVSLRGLLGPLQAVAAYLSVKQIIEWTDHWIAAAGKIRVFTESQAQANVVLEEVFNIAQKVRQPLESMAQLYTRLSIAGAELGVNQGDMLKFSENVGKILAIQGTSALQARGALLQLSQAMGEGIVRAQEFNSLIENAPYLLKIAAQNIEGAGGSVAKLRTLMLDGKLKSREFFDAIMKGTKDIDAAFSNTRKTFSQSFTVLENAVTRFLGKLDEALGLSDKFYKAAVFISENLDSIAKGLLVLGSAIAGAFAPALVLRFAAALGVAGGALRALTAVLLTNPFVLLGAAAAYAVLFADKILIGVDHMTTLADVFTVLKPTALDLWAGLVDGATNFGTQVVSLAKNFEIFGRNLGEEIVSWWNKFTTFFDGLDMSFAGIVQGFARVFDRIGAIVLGTAKAIGAALGGLPSVVNQVGVDMRNYMRERMEELINAVIGGINKARALVGKDPLGLVTLQRETGSSTTFKDYGADIAKAFREGFESQGKALEQGVVSIFDRARKVAADRVYRELRNGERNAVSLQNPAEQLLQQGGDPKASKKAAAAAAKAAKQAIEDSQKEIQNLLARYKENASEMTETERHRQAMLKAQYDQGLLNYRTYSTELQRIQDEMSMRQRNELVNQQAIIVEKMNELRVKMKRAGVGDTEIANTLQALEVRLQGVNAQLTKVDNARTERLAQNLADALQPANELLRNAEKESAVLDNNYQQRIRQLQAVSNLNQLSEREQFILTGTNQLLNQYEDRLEKVLAIRDQMARDGAFDDLTNPAVAKTFNDLNRHIDQLRQRLQQIREEAPSVLGQAFDAQQTQKIADELEKGILQGIVKGGKNGARNLRQFINDELVRRPFQITIEAALKPIVGQITQAMASMMQPFINGLSGIMQNFLMGGNAQGGRGVVQGGGGFLGSLVNGAGVLGSYFGAGGLGGALAAGAGWLSGSTTLMGSLGAAGSLIGTGTAGGIMSGLAMGAGALGPIALGAMALHSIFSGDRGGPKVDGWTGEPVAGIARLSDQQGLRPMTDSVVRNLSNSFRSLAQAFGTSSVGFTFGSSISTDPQGTAPNEVGTNLRRNGQELSYSYNLNAGRGEEALRMVVERQSLFILVQALRSSGVREEYINYFESIRQGMDTSEAVNKLQEIAQIAQLTEMMRGLGASFVNFANVSVEARMRITEFAGGISEFQQGISAYVQNFFSDQERLQMQASSISNELRNAGINWSTSDILNMTKETFRAHVQGLDLSTEWGQRAYAALIRVAGAFAQVADAANNTANVEAQMRARRDAWRAEVDKARDAVSEAYQREKQTLTDMKDKFQSIFNSLKAFQNDLRFNDSLSIYTPQEQYSLARQELMRTAPASEDFPRVAKQFLEASREMFASGSSYTSDFNMVQNLLSMGMMAAQDQVSIADKQLAQLERMTAGILNMNTSIMTLNGAVYRFLEIMRNSPYLNPTQFGLPASDAAIHTPPTGQVLIMRPDGTTAFMWASQYTPGHAGGLDRVPRNDYVFRAHRNEAVLNAADASVWRSMQSGNMGMNLAPLLYCMEQLKEEVAELRKQQADATRAEIVANREALAQNAQAITTGVAAGMSRDNWKAKQQTEAKLT